jgi:small-conductance mechanosensitive channel/CRP-like cAMP-binding protein
MISLAWWIGLPADGALAPEMILGRILALCAVYLVFTVAQRFLARSAVMRSIGLPFNLLVLTLLAILLLKPVLVRMHHDAGDALLAAAVFLAIVLALKLLDLLFLDLLPQWRRKPQVPLVLRDIGRWAVATLALILVVRGFFPGVNLNVLAVSSLVVGYIVGNATQDTLGNLIAGLALNVERPFQIGDWVTVNGLTGVVVDTTWRATRLRTKADDYIVIPNASIAKEAITNFSRPTRNHGCYLTLGVSYETPPNKARRVILEVLAQCPGVCTEPAPSVYLTGYGDFSINFTIKFFIADFAGLDPVQSAVMDRIWYAFRREGISIPFPVQDCRERDADVLERAERESARDSVRNLLAGVDLFQTLSPSELDRLVQGAALKIYAGDERLCRQGEPGDSFYIIRTGRVSVSIAGQDGNPKVVAHLEGGAFFGEMSLLTGEPRSGTVTAEGDVEVVCVSKQDFAGLMLADAGLAVKLAAVLEARLAASRERASAAENTARPLPTQSALLARMKRFFGLA